MTRMRCWWWCCKHQHLLLLLHLQHHHHHHRKLWINSNLRRKESWLARKEMKGARAKPTRRCQVSQALLKRSARLWLVVFTDRCRWLTTGSRSNVLSHPLGLHVWLISFREDNCVCCGLWFTDTPSLSPTGYIFKLQLYPTTSILGRSD